MSEYAIRELQASKSAMCWVVAFSRAGQMMSKRFYWLRLGGKDAAHQAAINWRDAQLAKTRALTVAEFCATRRSNNSSDVPGVHFLMPARQPEGIWQAKIKLRDGTRFSRSFSVRLHGKDEAYRLAVAAREKMLLAVGHRPYVHDPLAKKFAAATP